MVIPKVNASMRDQKVLVGLSVNPTMKEDMPFDAGQMGSGQMTH